MDFQLSFFLKIRTRKETMPQVKWNHLYDFHLQIISGKRELGNDEVKRESPSKTE